MELREFFDRMSRPGSNPFGGGPPLKMGFDEARALLIRVQRGEDFEIVPKKLWESPESIFFGCQKNVTKLTALVIVFSILVSVASRHGFYFFPEITSSFDSAVRGDGEVGQPWFGAITIFLLCLNSIIAFLCVKYFIIRCCFYYLLKSIRAIKKNRSTNYFEILGNSSWAPVSFVVAVPVFYFFGDVLRTIYEAQLSIGVSIGATMFYIGVSMYITALVFTLFSIVKFLFFYLPILKSQNSNS